MAVTYKVLQWTSLTSARKNPKAESVRLSRDEYALLVTVIKKSI